MKPTATTTTALATGNPACALRLRALSHSSVSLLLGDVELVLNANQDAERGCLWVGHFARHLFGPDYQLGIVDWSSDSEVLWDLKPTRLDNVLIDPLLLLDDLFAIVGLATVDGGLVMDAAPEGELGSKDALDGEPFRVVREFKWTGDRLFWVAN